MQIFLSHLFNGIVAGSIYALVALGYSMVYGIVKLINFAHGDIIMVGAYLAWYTMSELKLPVPLALLASITGCAILGMTIERVAYRPLRKSPRISLLITAIGVSFLLQNLAMLIFSATPKTYINFIPGSFQIGARSVGYKDIVTILATIGIMILLSLFINKTRAGKAMRAVSEDTEAAQLMGVNVNSTISLTFAIGSGLASVAAILYCCSFPQVKPTMAAMLGLKAFVAAVLGGIGSIPGAMLGGFTIGIVEHITRGYLPSSINTFSDAVVFLILILVLLIKPAGLLGRKVEEKV